ncbi:MAG: hypothetical protein GWO41_06260 [candidate division Zixibacteria bacterium]|nr:hypothetical protein [candidate division Zixibacteria bacterium]NIR62791.1 hypothetical protein [candidate division Zixibacteria bacterium]NIS15894.1 hypothetical protein [candidate division Zixibacteria bacterium]NIS44861.1 hypothetical protein [candidate division Zixibacteria bacterium]NIT52342.1 hypothetical protein [candidate division Zixibacteria bacterium]
MKKLLNPACLILVFSIFACPAANADITIEMKSSVSGIPFLRVFEIDQITGIRGSEVFTATEGEIDVGDTAISFRSSTYMNTFNELIRFCNWTDSTCKLIDLTGLDQILSSDTFMMLMDTLDYYLDLASQYVMIDSAEMTRTGNSQKVSGYDCDEVLFTLSGSANPPLPQMPGDIKFSVSGSSWITDDFPNYDEYRNAIAKMTERYLTPEVWDIFKKILGRFGISGTYLDKSLELWQYLYVEMAINVKVELWSENMDVPSMAFNIRFNSVLVDMNFDKISDPVFEAPAGFETETVDLFKLMR